MKKIVALYLMLLLFKVTAAQTANAILFTENGERFTAILNGVRQNEKPETNVKITGLNAEFYKLKVIFEDPQLGEKNLNLYINTGTETSYCIKKNNKGEYVVRLVSEVPVAQAPASPQGQTVLVYNSMPVQETVTTHSTTTTHNSNPGEVSIHLGVNANDGGSVSINASGMDTEEEQTTVTHTTTTYTTTTVSHPQPVHPASYVTGYTGPIGCPVPMDNEEFYDLKNSISSKTFEDSRMTIAKQVLNDRCMVATQVKEVMTLFTFEDNRLEFAKYAYDRTYDRGNYYKVNDAFTFESSIDDLNTYIESRR